jgi:hypothetical protein
VIFYLQFAYSTRSQFNDCWNIIVYSCHTSPRDQNVLLLNHCTHGRLWSQNVAPFKGPGALASGLTGIKNALVKCVHFKPELKNWGVLSVLTNRNFSDWTSGFYLENRTFADIYVYESFLVLVWEITPEVCRRIFKYTLNILLPFLALYSVHVCYPLKTKNSQFVWHKGGLLKEESSDLTSQLIDFPILFFCVFL